VPCSWLSRTSIHSSVCVVVFSGSIAFNPTSICCRSGREVYADDISRSPASNFYQGTTLSYITGITLAGKSFSSHPRRGVRAYIHFASRLLTRKWDRDLAVGNVTNQTQPINTSSLTNTSTFQGQTAFNGYTYSTTVTYVSGLLQNTSEGVNHSGDVAPPGGFAIDGLVSVFEAHIVGRPTPVNASS